MLTPQVLAKSPGKGRTIVLWAATALASLAFLAAGSAKVAGAAPMVAVFQQVGLGQWFRYVTGILEIGGAIGLLMPRTAFYAAALLCVVMVGAIAAHLTVLGGSPAPPLILLVLSGIIAFLRKPGNRV